MGRFTLILSIIMALCFAACQTLPSGPLSLEQAFEENVAISLPLRVSDEGLLIVENVQIKGETLQFVLDTGATQSAIFQNSLDRLGLDLPFETETMVHGMIQSQKRRRVNIPKITIGPIQFSQKPLIILDNSKSDTQQRRNYDGLIGMDVLINYHMLIMPMEGELRLVPHERDIIVPSKWSRIELESNPFQSDNRALHFFYMRLAGRRTPTLLDLGSEFSILNWSAAQFPQIRHTRRRLKKDWELQGAVGTFRPTAKFKLEEFRGGQKFWKNKDFIVMDFESLDILGVNEQPFIIAGMNLFAEDTVFLDFKANIVAIKPKTVDRPLN